MGKGKQFVTNGAAAHILGGWSERRDVQLHEHPVRHQRPRRLAERPSNSQTADQVSQWTRQGNIGQGPYTIPLVQGCDGRHFGSTGRNILRHRRMEHGPMINRNQITERSARLC